MITKHGEVRLIIREECNIQCIRIPLMYCVFSNYILRQLKRYKAIVYNRFYIGEKTTKLLAEIK